MPRKSVALTGESHAQCIDCHWAWKAKDHARREGAVGVRNARSAAYNHGRNLGHMTLVTLSLHYNFRRTAKAVA